MKKYFWVLMLAAAAVSAQTPPAAADGAKAKAPVKLLPPRVRTGSIVKAEFTTQKPEAEGESAVVKKSSPAWAVLTLQLDPGRAASIFDYALRKDGTEYPGLDLAEGDGPFEGKLRIYASVDRKNCRLVFAIPSAEDEYEIVFKLIEEDGTPAKLNVKPPPPEKKAEEEKKPDQDNKSDSGKKGDKPAE